MQELANRSLERGITIMEIIARSGEVTLADLHRESGLPKSTIRRLLGTLRSRRIVHRSLADKKYRINITMSTSAASPVPKGAGLFVDVALPILSEHTKRVGWPSDIHIIDGHAMRVIDSTRPLSPFHLYRSFVNRTVNMFGSATGQSCLALMADKRIRELLESARGDPFFGLERFSVSEEAFFDMIAAVRKRGYGIRIRQYRGDTVVDDKLGAIAVPVRRNGEVIGAVSLVFPRSLSTPEKMAQAHLASLKEAAHAISENLDRYSTTFHSAESADAQALEPRLDSPLGERTP